jgi:hypothetical protein
VLASLSLANLLAIEIWLVIFRQGQETPLPGKEFAAAVAVVMLLAGLVVILAWLLDRVPAPDARQILKTACLASMWMLIAWAALKPSLQQWLQYAMGAARTLVIGGTAALFALLVGMLCLHARTSFIWMKKAALVMVPFVLLTFGQSAWQVSRRGLADPGVPSDAVPLLAEGQHRARTVVLLFDEFDYELAFEPGVRRGSLPVMDGLASSALFATHAYPPMHSTAMSVPAMLTGRLVRDGKARDDQPGDLLVRFETGDFEPFSEQRTVFTRLREGGLTSLRMSDALLPHKRLAGLADADTVVPPARVPRSLWAHVAGQIGLLSGALPLLKGRGLDLQLATLLGAPHPSEDVSRVSGQMVMLATEGDADVLFLHILLPHLPVVFDPAAHAYSSSPSSDYRDNLPAVDQLVGRVLQGLRARGRIEDTHLLITSDHFFRFKKSIYGLGDHRVPFIVRFAGDAAPAERFDKPFNTVLLSDMLMDMAQRRVPDSASLAAWIDAHARFGESPLLRYRAGW